MSRESAFKTFVKDLIAYVVVGGVILLMVWCAVQVQP